MWDYRYYRAIVGLLVLLCMWGCCLGLCGAVGACGTTGLLWCCGACGFGTMWGSVGLHATGAGLCGAVGACGTVVGLLVLCGELFGTMWGSRCMWDCCGTTGALWGAVWDYVGQ